MTAGKIFVFGPFRLDPTSRMLKRDGKPVAVTAKTLDALIYLASNPGRVLTKEELMAALWPDSMVEEANLTQTVSVLRRVLGDKQRGERYIATVPRRGYQFVAPVTEEVAQNGGPARKRPHWLGLAVAGAVTAAVVAVIWAGRANDVPTPSPRDRPTLKRLTTTEGLYQDPAVSRDGRWIAYASDRAGEGSLDIWIQPVEGGAPFRLTDAPEPDVQPSFSPDGKLVTFRSDREPPGIYVVPTSGGEPRLLARGGLNPKFSPIRPEVLYWTRADGPRFYQRSYTSMPGTKIFVVRADGGEPRAVTDSRFRMARVPIWSPDGERILFRAQTDPENDYQGDWWLISRDGAKAQRTGLRATLIENGLNRSANLAAEGFTDWCRAGAREHLYFSDGLGDTDDVWRLEWDGSSGTPPGPPQPVTISTSLHRSARCLPDGRLVMAGVQESSHVWSLPIDANTGNAIGEIERLTHQAGIAMFPEISRDGAKLSYQTREGNETEIHLLDLRSNQDSLIATLAASFTRPLLSPNGDLVLYTQPASGITVPGSSGLLLAGTAPSAAREIYDRAGALVDWSPDGNWALHWHKHESVADERPHIAALNIETGEESDILTSPDYDIPGARFSGDGRWLAIAMFDDNRVLQTCIARFQGARQIEESQLTCTQAEPGDQGFLQWSPDNRFVYFFSARDGYTCLYRKPFDHERGTLLGPGSVVRHFHDSRLAPGNVTSGGQTGPSVAEDKIVFIMGQLEGAIWLAEPGS